MLNASKILVAAFAATLLLGGCTTDGRLIVDVGIEGNVDGHYIGERRGYCMYRFPNGEVEHVYKSGYHNNVCPRVITREWEEERHRRHRRY
jgi:hypothetical protein